MSDDVTYEEARSTLRSIEDRRRQVIAEIDMPRWYWWGLAAGWIVLGAIADVGSAWLCAGATLLFGAVHSAVAQHVLSGRHRSQQLSVRAEVVSRHVPALVIGFLLTMTAVTVALALLADADGARHPVTMASVVVAVAVLLGGPSLMAAVRRRAERSAAA